MKAFLESLRALNRQFTPFGFKASNAEWYLSDSPGAPSAPLTLSCRREASALFPFGPQPIKFLFKDRKLQKGMDAVERLSC
jgi:hypothetical protein